MNTSKTNNKKITINSSETYINQRTGEKLDIQEIVTEAVDCNFHKLWLGHIIQTMDIIGNQKAKFAFWLLDNMDYNNKITLTPKQMAKNNEVSLSTIKSTLKALVESEFLIKINMGVYQVNPDVVFKGSHNGRMSVLYTYKNLEIDNMQNTKTVNIKNTNNIA